MTVNPVAFAADTVKSSAQSTIDRAKAATDGAQPSVRKGGASDRVELTEEEKLKLQKLTEATKQFEAIFVRQLLKTAKFGGEAAKKGHGAMIVDAMARSVTQGGGLGFARMIRDNVAEAYFRNAGMDVSREMIAAALDED